MTARAVVPALGAIAAAAGLVMGVASWRWRSTTAALVARLRSRAPGAPASRHGGLDALPSPVADYLRAVLPSEDAAVDYVRLEQRGEFLARPGDDGWRPFVATEHFSGRRPGFVWDARIRMAPGFTVRVRDGFVAGRGSMVASVLGIYPMVSVEGSPELGVAALQRYLAEAVWIPSALVPGGGVRWSPLSASSARATIDDGGITASVDFHFGSDGLVERIFTDARGRDVGGRLVPTPWQGRFSRYEVRDGYRIPMGGEVEWLLPEGPAPYWRGEVTAVAFDAGR